MTRKRTTKTPTMKKKKLFFVRVRVRVMGLRFKFVKKTFISGASVSSYIFIELSFVAKFWFNYYRTI